MDPVGILSAVEIKIPIYILISYIALISICLLLRRIHLGLAVSFLFVFYIGYLYNRSFLIETLKGSPLGIVIYAGLGLVTIVLAIISFLSSHK
ncbi:MAG: hypothetical protein JSU78_04425 [Deltaproteobacteria bacterium]|nr:MAG: hypothetical protein JSU78_04425 [Deltaproteobacteria bacterium]